MLKAYKNFLIINRDHVNIDIKNVMEAEKITFDNDDIWHIKSSNDKIILVYDLLLSSTDSINANFNNKINSFPIGYIKIYCQGVNIKVYDLHFRSIEEGKKSLLMFKNYIRQSIKDTGMTSVQIDKKKFMLYWCSSIYTNLEEILKCMSFVSNLNKKTYNLSGNNVLGVSPTINKNPFNVLGLSSSSGFTPFGKF
jgi:hypothetical protein